MQVRQAMFNRRVGAAVLALALLATQTLGLLHRAAHAPVASQASSQVAPAPDGMFTMHESGSGDCRLYDQLAHSDIAHAGAIAALPLAVPVFWLNFSLGEALARWAALYDARGPPASR